MTKHDPFRPDSAVKLGEARQKASETGSAPEPLKSTLPAGSKPEENENGVPKGTIKEVLAWVGDDPEKAQDALDAETADESPRSTLVEALVALIDAEAPADEEEKAKTDETGETEASDSPAAPEGGDKE